MVLTILKLATSLRFLPISSKYTSAAQTKKLLRDKAALISMVPAPKEEIPILTENKNFRDDFKGTRIFVQNIPLNADWKQLKDHFKSAGSVVYASISQDPVTRQSKGCGIIQYETTSECKHALATLNQQLFGHQHLNLRPDLQEKRSTGKTAIQSTHWSEQPPKGRQTATSDSVRPGDRSRTDVAKDRNEKKQNKIDPAVEARTVTDTPVESKRKSLLKPREASPIMSSAQKEQQRKLLSLLDSSYEEDIEEESDIIEVEEEVAPQKESVRIKKTDMTKNNREEEEEVASSFTEQPMNPTQKEFIRIKKSDAIKNARKASGIWTHDRTTAESDMVSDADAAVIQSVVMEREEFRAKKNFEMADAIRMALRRERRVQLNDSLQQWRVLPLPVEVQTN
jgi:RNA recognition motif-containing protein